MESLVCAVQTNTSWVQAKCNHKAKSESKTIETASFRGRKEKGWGKEYDRKSLTGQISVQITG